MTNQTNDKPGLHPLPPSDLSQRKLPLKIFSAKTIFARIHKLENDPIYCFCLALYQLKTKYILQVVNLYELMSDEYLDRLADILDEYKYGLK